MSVLRKGKLKATFLLEGYDITSYVTRYSVMLESLPIAVVNISKPTGAFQILPGTLLHIFIRDEADVKDYNKDFLIFEGSLSSKKYEKSSSKSELVAIFKGTGKILDDSKYTKGSATDGGMLDLFNTDVLYVNLGMGNVGEEVVDPSYIEDKKAELAKKEKEKADGNKSDQLTQEINELKNEITAAEISPKTASRMIFVNPANNPQELVSGALWDKMKAQGKGFNDVLKLLLEGMTINVPYFRVIDESLKFTDQFAIYSNEALKPIFDELNGFNILSLSNPNPLTPYRTILQEYCAYNMLKVIDMGIPGYHDGAIVKQLIVPDLNFTAPPLFNVIYPDEYDDFQISMVYANEPTRASFLTSPVTLTTGSDTGVKVVPTFISPSTSLEIKPSTKGEKVSYLLAFTEEEKYRGISALEMQGNAFEQSWAKLGVDNADVTGVYTKEDANTLDNKEVQGMYRFISDYTFLKNRLNARVGGTITVNTFNPHWLSGFPGLIISPHYGPILVNFLSITLEGDASGFCRSTIQITNPRFLDELGEYVRMDMAPPVWYNKDFNKLSIGAKFYSKFRTDGKPSSIIDWTGVKGKSETVVGENKYDTSIEQAARIIFDKYMLNEEEIPEDLRRRRLVTSTEYFKFLNVDHIVGGFPSKDTLYRKAKGVDPFGIAYYASKGKNRPELRTLRKPFVGERGDAVAEWLGVTKRKSVYGGVIPPKKISADEEKNLNYPNTTSDEEMKRRAAAKEAEGAAAGVQSDSYQGTTETPTINIPKIGEVGATDIDKAIGKYLSNQSYPDFYPLENGTRNSMGYLYMANKGAPTFYQGIHRGTDYHPVNSRRVRAAGAGVVSFIRYQPGVYDRRDGTRNYLVKEVKDYVSYGNYVEITHYTSSGKNVLCRTFYAHLEKISIKVGDKVSKGQEIGIAGETGVPSNGNNIHLHFEIYDAKNMPSGLDNVEWPKGSGQWYVNPEKVLKQ